MHNHIPVINMRSRLMFSLVVPAILLVIACKTRPSDTLLQVFKNKEQRHIFGIEIVKCEGASAYEEVPYDDAYNRKLSQVMDILSRDLGFQVETATYRPGGSIRRPIASYRVVAPPSKPLPGIEIKEAKTGWELIPDFKDEVVIEKAVSADDGIEQMREGVFKAGSRGLKGEALAAAKEEAAKKMADVRKNIARIQEDLGAKRVWWVEFRHRPIVNLPPESPLWKLGTVLLEAPPGLPPGASAVPLATMKFGAAIESAFFEKKGQMNLNENLKSYTCVLFESENGSLLRFENISTFLPH